MALKIAILILALGLFVFMGMALLNVEAQRAQVAILGEQMARLQAAGGPASAPGASGGGSGRVATFDAVPPAFFDPANAATPQVIPVQPATGSGTDIQLAAVTLVGVEGASGVLPLTSPAVLVQKGVAQEIRGGCSVDAPPTGAWVLSLQGAGLQVASRDCVARSGLRPRLKVTVFQ